MLVYLCSASGKKDKHTQLIFVVKQIKLTERLYRALALELVSANADMHIHTKVIKVLHFQIGLF